MLIIFNPSYKRSNIVKLKIDSSSIKVLGENNKPIEYDVICYNSD